MKKASNHKPEGLRKPPAPPAPPPGRTFKQTVFSGFVETTESKQMRRDWLMYIKGYGDGIGGGR